MEILVNDFKKALETVKPGVSTSQTTMEQVTSFAFTNKNVISYNDEICITHPLADLDIQGAIEAELLYKFISKIKTERISLEMNDTSVLMKADRIKATFNFDSEIKLPLDDEKLINKGKWKDLPDGFLDALYLAKGCATKDMLRAKLNCVHINKSGFIESTDSFRIFRYNFTDKLPVQTVLIPSDSVASIIRLKPNQVAKGDSWIHFKNEDGTTISCRVLNEEFVNTEPFLRKEKKGIDIKFPEELLEALDTAEIFAENSMVKVTINKKKLIISSELQIAAFKETLELKDKVDSFAFYITPYILKDILKQIQTCTLYNRKLIFESDNWIYMTELSLVED